MYCNKCGNKLADGTVFCEKCGTEAKVIPREDSVNTSQPQKVQTYTMINKYNGEPFLGFIKASGTLSVYPEYLEFKMISGNVVLGPIVSLIEAAVKAKKEGNVERYFYSDIKRSYVGKYVGIQPALVIVMKDGRKFSFAGTFTKQSAGRIVDTILSYKSNT